MQNQQLLPKGEVLEEEFSSRAKGGDNPAEQTSKAQHKFSLGTGYSCLWFAKTKKFSGFSDTERCVPGPSGHS